MLSLLFGRSWRRNFVEREFRLKAFLISHLALASTLEEYGPQTQFGQQHRDRKCIDRIAYQNPCQTTAFIHTKVICTTTRPYRLARPKSKAISVVRLLMNSSPLLDDRTGDRNTAALISITLNALRLGRARSLRLRDGGNNRGCG
jgi:hypothetical protein